RAGVEALVAARHAGYRAAAARAGEALDRAQGELTAVRGETVKLIAAADPGAQTSDTNYVFLSFVLHHLPIGIIGLVLAAVFAASMNSTSAEMNALASTTVVDVYKRFPHDGAPRPELPVSRLATPA